MNPTPKPILDMFYKIIDPLLQRFGLGKSDFVALVVIVLNLAIQMKWLPPDLGQWLIDHWSSWMAVAAGAWGLGIRDAIRRATPPPIDPTLIGELIEVRAAPAAPPPL